MLTCLCREYFEDHHEQRELAYSIVDPIVETELGQFWPLKDYDGILSITINQTTHLMPLDTERGPIQLPKELYPEGSKRNWAGNQVYNPIYEVSPVTKEQAKQV